MIQPQSQLRTYHQLLEISEEAFETSPVPAIIYDHMRP